MPTGVIVNTAAGVAATIIELRGGDSIKGDDLLVDVIHEGLQIAKVTCTNTSNAIVYVLQQE